MIPYDFKMTISKFLSQSKHHSFSQLVVKQNPDLEIISIHINFKNQNH